MTLPEIVAMIREKRPDLAEKMPQWCEDPDSPNKMRWAEPRLPDLEISTSTAYAIVAEVCAEELARLNIFIATYENTFYPEHCSHKVPYFEAPTYVEAVARAVCGPS